MDHLLTIHVSDETYQQLQQWAEREGRSAEELADRYLTQTVQRMARDPLLKWAGAFQSDVTDAAERHDYYLGENLARELRGDADA